MPESPARAGEARRRTRAVVTRPPNKARVRHRFPRPRPRVLLVVIIESD